MYAIIHIAQEWRAFLESEKKLSTLDHAHPTARWMIYLLLSNHWWNRLYLAPWMTLPTWSHCQHANRLAKQVCCFAFCLKSCCWCPARRSSYFHSYTTRWLCFRWLHPAWYKPCPVLGPAQWVSIKVYFWFYRGNPWTGLTFSMFWLLSSSITSGTSSGDMIEASS